MPGTQRLTLASYSRLGCCIARLAFRLLSFALLALGLAVPASASAAAVAIPQPQPIVGTWQFEGARINVVGSSGVYYGAVVSGSYGGCGEKVPPGDIAWKSLSGAGLLYSGRTPWFNTDGCSPIGDGPMSIMLPTPMPAPGRANRPTAPPPLAVRSPGSAPRTRG